MDVLGYAVCIAPWTINPLDALFCQICCVDVVIADGCRNDKTYAAAVQ